jgi:hypothetical protein
MTYVAEPYAQFVDDLLTGLTGGKVRETFRMLDEEQPFRLTATTAVLPASVRAFGQIDNAAGKREFRRFVNATDFTVTASGEITWRADADGAQAADAQWPATGSTFYVNYEASRGARAAPRLTDRSPGSITRLLAESVGREYAVLSGQLEQVYQAGFLDTAGGRDLDNLVALVGLTRHPRNVAVGAVTFSRSTPAPGDISIVEGSRVSTADAPAVTFETTGTVVLQRGQLSVDAPVRALVADSGGVVTARAVTVVNRPVVGIETVSNAEPTRFNSAETDELLRARARRAAQREGQATVAALIGALTSLAGVRAKDMRFTEDPIERPGIVNLDLALPDLPPEQVDDYKRRAVELLDETRPAGIRIRHNIEAPRPPGTAEPGVGQPAPLEGDPVVRGNGVGDDLHMAVDANVTLRPRSLALTPDEREALVRAGVQVVEDFIAEAGLGETLVYNALVSQLMALGGVLDVTLELFPSADTSAPRTRNVMPNQLGARPVAGVIDVQVGNALVALDVSVALAFSGAGTIGSPEANAAGAAADIRSDLQAGLANVAAAQIDPAVLTDLAGQSESYEITALHYRVDYVDAGVRISQTDITLPLTGLEHFWVRRVDVVDENGDVIGSNT